MLRDDALLADMTAPCGEDEFRLWWLGQSGFLLKWGTHHLLLDPYLSDSLTRKYAGTDRPHIRMTDRPVDPSRLGFVEVVTSSHNHTDHLDPDTLKPLVAANPGITMVCPAANRDEVAVRSGLPADRLVGLDDLKRATAGAFEFHGIAAAHPTVEHDKDGRCRFMGYVVAFGPFRVYHAGDTVFYHNMGRHFPAGGLDVALAPINGDDPKRGVAGNWNGQQAAWMAQQRGAKVAIPMHYEMFEFNTAPPDEFVAECARLGQPCRVLKCGERWSSRDAGI